MNNIFLVLLCPIFHSLLFYLLFHMSSKKKTFSVKMVLCGDIGVGKTCLFTRITDLEYNPNPITTSNDYHKKTYEKGDKIINCEIWDTAGQDDYQSMLDTWINSVDGFILVYSIDDKDSFESMKMRYERIIKNKSASVILSSNTSILVFLVLYISLLYIPELKVDIFII